MKTILILPLLALILQATEPIDRNFSVTPRHVDAMKAHLYEKTRFKPNADKDVIQILQDNHLLAQQYLSKLDPQQRQIEMDVILDEVFAEKMIKDAQRKAKIPEDVVRSYYLDNLENYRLHPLYTLHIYQSDDFEQLFQLFQFATDHGAKDVSAKAEALKLKAVQYRQPYKRMPPYLRDLLDDSAKAGKYFPPLYTPKGFVVIHVADVKPQEGYWDFQNAAISIRSTLYQKTYLRMRDTLLKELRHE